MNLGYINIVSGYTFLTSSLKIDDIVNIGKEKNLPFLALTDVNNMFGAYEFYKKCKESNIKPIVGMEVRTDIDEIPLILLASSNEGYLNLCRITSIVSNDSISFITLEQLNEYKNGLICIVPYIRSHIDELSYDEKRKKLDPIKFIFKSFYLGLECYGENDVKRLNNAREFASFANYKTIPCQQILCQDFTKTYLLDILRAIKNKTRVELLEKENYENKYFLTEQKAKLLFSEEEIKESNKIAEICDIDLSKIKSDLVHYNVPEGVDSFDYLYAVALKGLKIRLNNNVSDVYLKRLKYELSIIKQMNYVNYFLVVFDYVRFAKLNKISVGPGRGSACGSLVCYCLGITNIDPIKYNLLFERFLNPERKSMPDIDCDFMDTRRDEVIEYIINKYGDSHIARVVSFQTLKAKSCIRDVSGALGLLKADIDELAEKLTSTVTKASDDRGIEELANDSPSFLSLIRTNEKYNEVYKAALQLEGLPRQTSIHAAGVVCCNTNLCDCTPVYKSNNMLLTQYSGDEIEDFNLYKMDILSLTNLSIINSICNDIKEKIGKEIDINNIDLGDSNIYKVLYNGWYGGIFQIDGNSVKSAVRKIKCSNFIDTAVALAIGRPGTKDLVESYALRKFKKEKIEYIDKSVIPYLSETYGIILYQEQIMHILCTLAKFSLGKASLIIKAISKKKKELIQEYQIDFVNGCVNNGYSKQQAIQIYSQIEKFGSYGFNKAHTVAYGVISAQMCYLKYYYPSFYYRNILDYSIDTKINDLFFEMEKRNIHLLPPSINKSSSGYEVDGDNILYSLTKIADIKPATVNNILEERNNGKFKDFTDFIVRMHKYDIPQKELVALIYSGCFDEFNINRTTLINNIDTVNIYASIATYEEDGKIIIDPSIKLPNIINYPDEISKLAELEKKYLGMNLKLYPLQADREKIKAAGFIRVCDVYDSHTSKVKLVVKINRIKLTRQISR